MERRRVEEISRKSALRYNKNTLCSIIQDPRIVNLLLINSILPEGFFLTDRNLGYSSIMNRVIALPQYTYLEIKKILDNTQRTSPTPGENTNAIETRLGATRAVESMLRESILVIYLSNFSVKEGTKNDLLKYDVIIEDLDIMGTIEGRVVPKTGNPDDNASKKLDD